MATVFTAWNFIGIIRHNEIPDVAVVGVLLWFKYNRISLGTNNTAYAVAH